MTKVRACDLKAGMLIVGMGAAFMVENIDGRVVVSFFGSPVQTSFTPMAWVSVWRS